jgi:hypothetical protein
MNKVTTGAILSVATLLTGRAVAQESLECAFFPKPNLIMVGGHEDNTPVIPVVLDYVTLDLTTGESCHAVTFSVATEEGTDANHSREKFCFKIRPNAVNEEREIKATFKNIPDNSKWAGLTQTVAKVSAWEDRATAIELAEKCRMQLKRPQGEGADGGLDIKYMRRLPPTIPPAA